jgi:hypothetical protein
VCIFLTDTEPLRSMLRGGIDIRGSPIRVKRNNPSLIISKPSVKKKAEDALDASAWRRHILQSTSSSSNNGAGEVRVMIGQGSGRTSIRGIASVLPRSPVQTNYHNSNNTMMLPDGPNNLPVVMRFDVPTVAGMDTQIYPSQKVVMMMPAPYQQLSAAFGTFLFSSCWKITSLRNAMTHDELSIQHDIQPIICSFRMLLATWCGWWCRFGQ